MHPYTLQNQPCVPDHVSMPGRKALTIDTVSVGYAKLDVSHKISSHRLNDSVKLTFFLPPRIRGLLVLLDIKSPQ
jgi:hypothetical protein